jgi:O-antigen/teichoic acid export membrane protein
MRKFGTLSLQTFIYQALGLALGLLGGVIVARWLGPTAKGAIALYTIIAGFLSLAGNLGLGLANVHLTGSRQLDPGRAWANSLWFSLLAGSLLSVATVFLFPIVGIVIKRPIDMGLMGIALFGVPLLLMFDYQVNLLRGLSDIKGYNVSGFIRQAGRFLLLATLVAWLGGQVASALWSVNIALVLCLIWGAFRLRKSSRLSMLPSWKGFKQSLSYGLKGQLGQVVQFFNYRLDMILLAAFWTNREVGIYATAVFLAELIWQIPAAVSTVLLPAVSSSDSGDQAAVLSIRAIRHTMFWSLTAALMLGLAAEPLINLLYGQPFSGAVWPMRVLLLGIVLLSPAKLIVSHLAGVGKPQYVTYLALSGLGLTVFLDLILIPRFGIMGAAWASSSAYCCSGIISLVWLKRYMGSGIKYGLVLQKEDWQVYRQLIDL